MRDLIIGYKIQYTGYQEVNVLFGNIFHSIYKSYMQSERRSIRINMLNTLYFELLMVNKLYEKKTWKNLFIKQFNKVLKEHI